MNKVDFSSFKRAGLACPTPYWQARQKDAQFTRKEYGKDLNQPLSYEIIDTLDWLEDSSLLKYDVYRMVGAFEMRKS